jgi:hypothetical protein
VTPVRPCNRRQFPFLPLRAWLSEDLFAALGSAPGLTNANRWMGHIRLAGLLVLMVVGRVLIPESRGSPGWTVLGKVA